MADAASLNQLVDEAVTAIGNADWSGARSKLLQAKATLVAIPDGQQGPDSLSWDRDAIDELLDDVNRQEASGRGVHRSPVKYVRDQQSC